MRHNCRCRLDGTMQCNDSQVGEEAPRPSREPTAIYEANDDESITVAVTTALSAAFQTDRSELDPLYTVVDPDALNSLFDKREDGTPRGCDGHIAFDYGPYCVRVEADGTAVVYESEQ